VSRGREQLARKVSLPLLQRKASFHSRRRQDPMPRGKWKLMVLGWI
jgi:hypothetical protein